jgi:protein-tyrosine phosphatase
VHILFICTGNICRSPTAERLVAAHGAEPQGPTFTVSSAGTRAMIGHPMHETAAAVLKELGGDPSGFTARQLTPKVAAHADLVLTMTTEHRDRVLQLVPRLLHKIFTLPEAARLCEIFSPDSISTLATLRPHLGSAESLDIADPIGQSPHFFRTVGSQISDLLPPVLELCQRSASANPVPPHDPNNPRFGAPPTR